jgi:hypothetical protein
MLGLNSTTTTRGRKQVSERHTCQSLPSLSILIKSGAAEGAEIRAAGIGQIPFLDLQNRHEAGAAAPL